uniref:Uncharacterized protein n=1 Tax=Clytia hemisphaerica TaxID=252671 RepID=A0A7M6DQD0_9CNID
MLKFNLLNSNSILHIQIQSFSFKFNPSHSNSILHIQIQSFLFKFNPSLFKFNLFHSNSILQFNLSNSIFFHSNFSKFHSIFLGTSGFKKSSSPDFRPAAYFMFFCFFWDNNN